MAGAGCSPDTIGDPAAYLRYLADQENGLVRQKAVGGFNIRMKYLPPDYMAYRELSGGLDRQGQSIDSLAGRYQTSATFLLTITPEDTGAPEIARLGVSNYEEFSRRILDLNFHLREQLWLENEGRKVPAVLTEFERNYGLDRSGNIIIVFNSPPPEREAVSDWVVVWNDELFHTGLHRFLFKQADIRKMPRLQLTH